MGLRTPNPEIKKHKPPRLSRPGAPGVGLLKVILNMINMLFFRALSSWFSFLLLCSKRSAFSANILHK